MKTATGETLAVLQAINKLDGGFTEADAEIVAKLSMLAGIATADALANLLLHPLRFHLSSPLRSSPLEILVASLLLSRRSHHRHCLF